MCGIAGVFASRGDPPADLRERALRMNERIVHRGPDDHGLDVFPRAALGMRRLSIIDVSGGHQPIRNEDGRLSIVFNGEIYNYLELRGRLEARHHFKTRSDTETILHLYEELGPGCLRELNGMFAFAIFDAAEERLFLARDRFGIKPLYYLERDGLFCFASEIPALLEILPERPDVDPDALDVYLALGYLPAPYTIYRGIRQLPAAHDLVVDARGVRTECYWELDYSPRPERDERFYTEEIGRRLKEAVRLQLQSEVPLGAFLSGGLDSTAVVALMSELGSDPVKTFSIGFEEEGFSELDDAREVAERYGTDHSELVVGAEQIPDSLERCIRHMGGPFGAWSLVLNDLVAELARSRVTVALAGHGGDELFAGYPTLTAHKLLGRYQRLPGFVRGAVRGAVGLLPSSEGNMAFEYKARLFLRGAEEPYEDAFYSWKRIFPGAERRAILAGCDAPLASEDGARDLYRRHAREVEAPDRISRLLHVDTRVFLEGSCLAAADRTSMLHSLEVRVPILDHTLAEFAAGIPARLKHRGSETKRILRRALAPWLPERLLKRPKTGFVLPETKWLRGPLSVYLRDCLDTLRRWDWIGERGGAVMDRLAAEHLSGRANHGRQLTTLVSLAVWYDQHRRGEPGKSD